MWQPPSSVDLRGYPMVFSYPEKMINKVFAVDHTAGDADMFPMSLECRPPANEYALEIEEFGVPTMNFDVPLYDQGVNIIVPVVTGSMEMWVLESFRSNGPPIPTLKSFDLSGKKVTITVEIKKTSLEPTKEAFSRQCLYADFTDVSNVVVEFGDTVISAAVKVAISTAISDGLKAWAAGYMTENGKPPCCVGGVRLGNTSTKGKGLPLRPTSFNHSVTRMKDGDAKYAWGALNLLLQIDNEPCPTGAGCGIFNFPLTDSDSLEGVLVISSYAFAKDIVEPSLAATYRLEYKFGCDHGVENSRQGDVHLEEGVDEYSSKLVWKTSTRVENISGQFVADEQGNGVCRIEHASEGTIDVPLLPDVEYSGVSHFDLKFNVDNGELKVGKSDQIDKVEMEFGVPLLEKVAKDVVSTGLTEMGFADGGDESERITSLEKISEEKLSSVPDCILAPGWKGKSLSMKNIRIRKAANGQYNMFIYGKFGL